MIPSGGQSVIDRAPMGMEPPIAEPLGNVPTESITVSAMQLLNSYAHIFVAAFLVTLLVTPVIRRVAAARGVVDLPDAKRKMHAYPVAYLGGVALFIGLIVAIGVSYLTFDPLPEGYHQVPIAVVVGMVLITFTGLADDVWGWDPRLKIAGQFVAAAALALEDVGVRVASGILSPVAHWVDPLLGCENLAFTFETPVGVFAFDTVYWVGVVIVAIFVLGGCNSANLIDGLDGLLSGIVAIVMIGLLSISLLMAIRLDPARIAEFGGTFAGARIVLCVAVLGAVLGFLPHNFNPASIFLGDCGSLLLGYLCVVIILMLGEYGHTHLVFAGLIVYSVPIMDTTLAIIRRRLAGVSISAADHQHIHHQLKHALGGVKRAVFALYGISLLFAALGVALAALVMYTELRVRVIYAIALVLFGCIAVIAVKAARRQQRLAAEQRARNAAAKAARRRAEAVGRAPASGGGAEAASPRPGGASSARAEET